MVLVPYDSKKLIALATVASPYSLGAIISQVMEDGLEWPIAYTSRSPGKAEQGYSQMEKEGLAIVFGVNKFHKYLYGQRFSLCTDHRLVSIFATHREVPSFAALPMQHWALIHMMYKYDVHYKRSEDNSNADALSHVPDSSAEPVATEQSIDYFSYSDAMPVTTAEIAEETWKDVVLSQVLRQKTMSGWPSHCNNEDLMPYFKWRNKVSNARRVLFWGVRVIIPPKYMSQLVGELHQEHTSVIRMKPLAQS